ncbi:MAG: Usg family protein [Rhodospirillaceae bacterium]|jgi:uncharacterized protein Usg|nr:Usg family protein [Rhodospirillales bacterium]MBT3905082.1 Usg family protein [Rhodospirillaceae bacterium]MBT4699644.1 Usg family protein [Rhodospirillaceae bacterium]MBT5034255.1 Usg family protein [Rhodospirillaceae bacterium]MBT6218172.1 Usg family protein [Rhodospirillaceae bacterium]
MSDLKRQLKDYRLTTAEILYHMPDLPSLLQSFVWQKLDLAPQFPELKKFLDFWEQRLDGKLHSVRVANAQLIKPAEVRLADGEFIIH